MKLLYVLPILLTLPMVSFAKQVKPTQDIKGYVGFNINYNGVSLNDKMGEYLSDELGTSVSTDDLINTDYYGLSLNIGADINKYFGVEGFLQYMFHSSADISFYDIYNTKVGKYESKVSSFAFGIDAIGYLPLADTKVSLIGSAGLGYYTFNGKFTGTNYIYDLKESDSDDESNVAFRIGFGAQYAFSEKFAARGIIRYVALNSDDEDVVESFIDVSLGIKYAF